MTTVKYHESSACLAVNDHLPSHRRCYDEDKFTDMGCVMSLVNRPARLLALMSMLFFVCSAAHAKDFAAPVDVDTVTVAASTETVNVIGRVVALQSGNVAARTTAAVKQIRVQVGDKVTAGQVLVELHNNRQRSMVALMQADITQWAAKVKSAQVKQDLAASDLQRLEKLRGSSAFNQSLYDQRFAEAKAAEAGVLEAKASLSYAKVQLKRSQQDLDWALVTAPYDGVVTARRVAEGEWVALGAPVVDLVSTSALEIEADVSAQYLQFIKQGAEVMASVNGQPLALTLRAILPAEQSLSRTQLARFSLSLKPEQRPNLSVNQAVNVAIPVGAKDALTVHKDAVVRNGSMSFVYKVLEGVATFTPVQLGASSGQRLQVLDGLKAGDVVVTRGNERLQPGQKVQTRNAGQ